MATQEMLQNTARSEAPAFKAAAEPIPRDKRPEGTLAFLLRGYAYIGDECDRQQTDVFRTRLLLRDTICMRGEAAARLFYDRDKFERKGAAPARLKATLFGRRGVQTLDGAAHRHRKQLFMDTVTGEPIAELVKSVEAEWLAQLERWQHAREVVLFEEVEHVLCRAVCRWAGVPLSPSEAPERTAQLHDLIDASGGVGPRHWQGRIARKQTNRWIASLVAKVRRGELEARPTSVLYRVAAHRELDGERLSEHDAAVEVINVLRPTVAVARFITFAALALHEHPDAKQELLEGGEDAAERFAQEVRRFYPFFPLVAARVKRDFEWKGYRFDQGTRVVLDLYGTNRDVRIWGDPECFRPGRFAERTSSGFDLIPQGGGDARRNHRCPGEEITVALMKLATRMLTCSMSYEVPKQDLSISLSRIPAIPKSRFVIRNVRRTA